MRPKYASSLTVVMARKMLPVIYEIFVLDLKLVKWENTEETIETVHTQATIS